MEAIVAAASPATPPPGRRRRGTCSGGGCLVASASLFRRGRRPSQRARDDRVELAGDAEVVVIRFLGSSEAALQRFASQAADAWSDFRSAVRVEPGGRVVVSCRRSSVIFASQLVMWGLALAVAARVLAALVGFWQQQWGSGGRLVVRRDRSLGGREVVVGVEGMKASRVSTKPLSSGRGPIELSPGRGLVVSSTIKQERRQKELPEWWPTAPGKEVEIGSAVDREDYQRAAQRLCRAMIDSRMGGKDFSFDDIIQLHGLCKASGAKVSFGTENVRDSFYRAATMFVLDACSRTVETEVQLQINGENPRTFISNLAQYIGLENSRAATIVSAAVAASTRASILQCWALEAQKRRAEALGELAKICLIHTTFPPGENSAEMEMVANGLKKNLTLEERVHLLSLLRSACHVAGSQRTVAEALGLYREDYSWLMQTQSSDSDQMR